MQNLCICILAHNEQKHIAATIEALAGDSVHLNCDIKVYANGCTDATVAIVRDLSQKIPNLSLRELAIASKPNAWNTAFVENAHAVLVFSDGDVIPEQGAIEALWRLLICRETETVLAGCSLWPKGEGLTFGQRAVGFVQIPLWQTFLAGGLYAVHRTRLMNELHKVGISTIPLGIVGEDIFLEKLVPAEKFRIITSRVYYEPPAWTDFWKYLARIRWQEEQLLSNYGDLIARGANAPHDGFARHLNKAEYANGLNRLMLGVVATGLRCILRIFFKRKIQKHYDAMGPVNKEGGAVLSRVSRSGSVK